MSQIINSKAKTYIAAKKFLGDDVRKVFESLTAALSALRGIYAIESFPSAFPTVVAGVGSVDVTGDDSIPPFDSWSDDAKAVYTDSTRVFVAFIGVRKIKDPTDSTGESMINGAKGFVVYPVPTLSEIRESESGEKWLNKIAEKEASHVALRGLRNVPDNFGTDALAAAALSMPLSVDDYVEGSTAESLDTAAFDGLWKDFRKMLTESPDTATLVPALPVKAEVIKCIRSKAFAAENYPDLESMGAFVFIGDNMAAVIDYMREQASAAGTEYPLESDELKAWVAARDAFVFPTKAKSVANLAAVNLGGFAAALKGKTPATTGEESEGEKETADA